MKTTPTFTVLVAGLALILLPIAVSASITPRTVVNPASNSPLSSSIMRGELQTLENEIGWISNAVWTGSGSTTPTGLLMGNGTTQLQTVTLGTNLSLSGTTLNATGGGGSSASSTLLTDNNSFSGNSTFTRPLSLTSTTGTTTIASGQGFAIGTSQFVLQQGSGNVGVGSTTPSSLLVLASNAPALTFDSQNGQITTFTQNNNGTFVFNTATAHSISFNQGNATTFLLTSGGNAGFGTSSPGSLLSLNNIANFTTATSTFYGNGINLTNGCFAIGGVCVGGTVTSVTAATPNSTLTLGGTNPVTTSGTINFDINLAHANTWTAMVNTDGTRAWYQLGGSTIAYSSSTNSDAIFGTGAGGNNATTSAAAEYESAFGFNALKSNTTGSGNSAFGDNALGAETNAGFNTAVGASALENLTFSGSSFATAEGYFALEADTFGQHQTAIGYEALSTSNNSRGRNTAVGYAAAGSNIAGTDNTVVGSSAGDAGSSSFSTSTLVGFSSGFGLTTGGQNTFYGAQPDSGSNAAVTTGSQNIEIGYDVAVPSTTASGQMSIGNIIYGSGNTGTLNSASTGNIGIATTTPGSIFSINGVANFTTATSTFYGNGINISGGCFAINNMCLTSGGSSASSTLLTDSSTFSGGNIFNASTTIGNGTLGLTVNGSASTTGSMFIGGVGSTTDLYITGAVGDTGIIITGPTTGTGISMTTLTTGVGVNCTAGTTGKCFKANITATGATTQSAFQVTGSANMTADYTGAIIDISPTRNVAAAATRIHSGNIVQITPIYSTSGANASILTMTGTTTQITRTVSNASSNAGSSITVSAPLMSLADIPVADRNVTITGPLLSMIENATTSTNTLLFANNLGLGNLATFTGNGNFGIGTSTPQSILTITKGASATTTVAVGELGLSSSKACVNIQTSAGTAGFFYINGAGAVVSGLGSCTP